jgi:EmrB/QacA subfamily drug resistance transporter
LALKSDQSFLKKWLPMNVMALALAIIVIDTTVLNVALASIIRDFHTTIQNLQWVISAYTLTVAALTITGGRLGDLFGRKRMFIVGAILFGLGSFITSISHGVGTMLAGESIIEGIGAALMLPATASLIVANYRGRDRATAFGLWGGVAAASSALGPILGGWLTTNYSWRWAFRINIFVVVLLIIGSLVIKESQDIEEKPSLDWLGVFLSSAGLLAIVYGFIEASTYGWLKASQAFAVFGHNFSPLGLSIVPIALLVGIVFLGLFFRWQMWQEKHHRTPLVSTKIFKNHQFVSGNVTTAATFLAFIGLIFALPIFFLGVRGYSAFHAGYALLPLSAAALFGSPVSAKLGKRFSPKHIIQTGTLCMIVGALIMSTVLNINTTVLQIAFGEIIYGLGLGFVIAQITNLTLSAVSVQEAGEASGVNNTLRQIGATLGSSIIGAVLLTALLTNIRTGIKNDALIPASSKTSITMLAQSHSSAIEFGAATGLISKLPVQLQTQVNKVTHQATTDAIKRSLLFSAAFSGIALLVSSWLPISRDLEKGQSLASK